MEITAISSPESSLKSSPVPYQDNDQPPVLKKEKPLSQTNGAHYSPLTSDEEQGSEDEPGSARQGWGQGMVGMQGRQLPPAAGWGARGHDLGCFTPTHGPWSLMWGMSWSRQATSWIVSL